MAFLPALGLPYPLVALVSPFDSAWGFEVSHYSSKWSPAISEHTAASMTILLCAGVPIKCKQIMDARVILPAGSP